jgi:Big-like domain-containing protein
VGTIATYSPAAGYLGPDSFTYTVEDGLGGSATATVSITVNDQAPIANDDTITTPRNRAASKNVLANDRDPDRDAISVTSFTQGAHGTVTIVRGVATYTPAAGFVGTDSFTYTITDGHGLTATATVNVTVT